MVGIWQGHEGEQAVDLAARAARARRGARLIMERPDDGRRLG